MRDDQTAAAPAPEPARSIPRQVRIIRAVFAAAVLLLAGVAALGYYSTSQNAENAHWVDHTYEVMLSADRVIIDHQAASGDARAYILTGDPQFLASYQSALAAIPHDIDALDAMVRDNQPQVRRVAALRAASAARLAIMVLPVRDKKPGVASVGAVVAAQLPQAKALIANLRAITDQIGQAESGLLAGRQARVQHSREITLFLMAVAGAISIIMLCVCLWLLTREIGERRRAEARVHALNLELAGRNAQLELTNRELEGFSYSISHDLRAPLRAIDGFAQLLRTRYGSALDAEAMRLLDVVRDSSKRMATLIDDLLAFSRMGRKPLDKEPLEMGALVGDCVAEVLRAMPERPRILIGPLPDCRGDPTLVRQVWVNLIGNAVKYSSHNPGARIEITGREEGHECIYGVRDNGVGFDMQYYHKLFGVFQRLHRADEFPGTGVGLAIVMRIVTKHGGRLWADAAVGQGANFLFSLPRTESP